jgi:hypothetical protein
MDWMKVFEIVSSALVAGVAGWWAHWKWNREETRKVELREQERQAEYEAFKKKRRLIGAGDVEKMERAEKLTEIMLVHLKHGITPETWDEMRSRILGEPQRRPVKQIDNSQVFTSINISGDIKMGENVSITGTNSQVSQNSAGKIGFDQSSQTVKTQYHLAEDNHWSGRDEEEILTAIDELFEMLWLCHYRIFKRQVDSGTLPPDANYTKLIEMSKDVIERYEAKYKDREDEIGEAPFDCGVLTGKMSALRWAMGKEWDLQDT